MRRGIVELLGRHGGVWRRAVLLALLCVALAAITAADDLHASLLGVVAASKNVIVDHPVWGALVFVFLAAIFAMLAFVSIAIVVPLAVYVWGTSVSLALLWLGWILGGAVAYGIARYFGRPVVNWLATRPVLSRVERRISPEIPFHVILLFQLGLPSEIPGYVLGLARYPFGKFMLALALAELPYAFAAVYLGAGFVSARSGLVLGIGLSIVMLSVGAFYLLRRHWRWTGVEGSR